MSEHGKGAEIRSGLFVILSVLVFTVLIFSVGRLKSGFTERETYVTFLEDAKFLRAHDAVTYAGRRVGEITSVEISEERFGNVRIEVAVEPGVPVRKDSILLLKQDGLLGNKYLEISPGTRGAAKAVPGSELGSKVIPAMTDMAAQIEEPLAHLNAVLKAMADLLGKSEDLKELAKVGPDIRALVADLRQQADSLTKSLLETSRKTQVEVEKISGSITAASEEARAVMAKNRPALDKLLSDTDALIGRLNRTADGLDGVVRDTGRLVGENSGNVHETIRSLRDTAHHLEMATRRIRANPAILLFGAEETPEELRRKDETELRLKGRARRYDKESPK